MKMVVFPSWVFGSIQSAAKTGVVGSELVSSGWSGFLGGCIHTLSGPDHLAALAPLSIGRTPLESAAVGVLWGCGHNAGQVIFGVIFLLLKDRLQIEMIKTWATRVVGFTLLVIGAMGIKHASLHLKTPRTTTTINNKQKNKMGFISTFATGIIHGLQPDALMMVLPALALPSRMAGAAFLLTFLVGTVVAMGCYTLFIASCSDAFKEKVPRLTDKLTWAPSIVATALGSAIIIGQLFGYSLY